MKRRIGYIAIGSNVKAHEYLTDPDAHPRGQLLRRLGVTSARKIYSDTKSGTVKHIGYVAAGVWFRIYEVYDWQGTT